jgi:Co/Zn/Cd efflux system component
MSAPDDPEARAYKRTIWAIVIGISLLLIGESALALHLENRLLLKDGLEWGYDVAIYAVAALAFGRGDRAERLSALAIAVVLAAAGVQGSYEVIRAVFIPPVIEPFTVGFSAISIIIEGLAVAAALWRFRAASNPLIEASWLSARNDAISATLFAIVRAAARLAPARWPQMAVDAFTAFLAFQAAWKIARDAWPTKKIEKASE